MLTAIMQQPSTSKESTDPFNTSQETVYEVVVGHQDNSFSQLYNDNYFVPSVGFEVEVDSQHVAEDGVPNDEGDISVDIGTSNVSRSLPKRSSVPPQWTPCKPEKETENG